MKQCAKGFTLLELLIVLSLVGILSVYILMKVPSTSVFDLSSTTEQLRRDIRYTQSLAMSLNTNYKLVFTSNGYSITPAPPSGNYSVTLPSGITLSGATSLTFDSMGKPSQAISLTITATGVGSNVLTVASETGFVNG